MGRKGTLVMEESPATPPTAGARAPHHRGKSRQLHTFGGRGPPASLWSWAVSHASSWHGRPHGWGSRGPVGGGPGALWMGTGRPRGWGTGGPRGWGLGGPVGGDREALWVEAGRAGRSWGPVRV